MRIAISVWEGRISPLFDTASRLMVLEMEDRKEISRFEIFFDEDALVRRCARIRTLNIDVLICGAVSRNFLSLLNASGIRIIPWICGSVESVLETFARAPDGVSLKSTFLMPGYRQESKD